VAQLAVVVAAAVADVGQPKKRNSNLFVLVLGLTETLRNESLSLSLSNISISP